jgi:hypothetical protein
MLTFQLIRACLSSLFSAVSTETIEYISMVVVVSYYVIFTTKISTTSVDNEHNT